MKELLIYLKEHNACDKLKSKTLSELSREMFQSYGIEYIENTSIPKELYSKYKGKLKGLFVDEIGDTENQDVLLVNSRMIIEVNDLEKVYQIVLIDSHATIIASNYAVFKVTNISGEYEVVNDGTAKQL